MAVAERELASGPAPWRWTRDQYHTMGDLGWFDDRRVELIEGEIIEMPPIGSRHLTAVILAGEALRAAFGAGYVLSIQSALGLGRRSEPQPDVAVLPGEARDYKDELPATAALVVEIADTTLTSDNTAKAAIYARAGVQDYWIINLNDAQVEVYRRPVPETSQPFGFGYGEGKVYPPGEVLAPLEKPDVQIAVSDLLP